MMCVKYTVTLLNYVKSNKRKKKTLFTLYINNVYLGTHLSNAYFYADDTILYAFGATVIQAFSRLRAAFDDLQVSLFNLNLILN